MARHALGVADGCTHADDGEAEDFVARVIMRCARAFRESGYTIDVDPLGCGYQGCVHQTSRDDAVLKITCEVQEARFSEWLRRRPNRPSMMPKILSVRRLVCGGTVDGHVYYGILREDLRDVTYSDGGSCYIDGDRYSVLDLLSSALPYGYEQAGKVKMLKRAERISKPQVVADGLELLAWTLENGIEISDLGARNWGKRGDGSLVIRDLGFIEAKIDSPLISLSGFSCRRKSMKLRGF